MSLCAGFDFDSENVWLALIAEDDGAFVETCRFELGGGDAFDRARRVRERMPARDRWADDGIVCAGVEMPFMRQRNSVAALMRVQGAILACLPAELLVIPLTPHERAPAGWKALIGLPTNASKAAIAVEAVKRGAPVGLRQDLYDAVGIAHAARALWLERTEIAA